MAFQTDAFQLDAFQNDFLGIEAKKDSSGGWPPLRREDYRARDKQRAKSAREVTPEVEQPVAVPADAAEGLPDARSPLSIAARLKPEDLTGLQALAALAARQAVYEEMLLQERLAEQLLAAELQRQAEIVAAELFAAQLLLEQERLLQDEEDAERLLLLAAMGSVAQKERKIELAKQAIAKMQRELFGAMNAVQAMRSKTK